MSLFRISSHASSPLARATVCCVFPDADAHFPRGSSSPRRRRSGVLGFLHHCETAKVAAAAQHTQPPSLRSLVCANQTAEQGAATTPENVRNGSSPGGFPLGHRAVPSRCRSPAVAHSCAARGASSAESPRRKATSRPRRCHSANEMYRVAPRRRASENR